MLRGGRETQIHVFHRISLFYLLSPVHFLKADALGHPKPADTPGQPPTQQCAPFSESVSSPWFGLRTFSLLYVMLHVYLKGLQNVVLRVVLAWFLIKQSWRQGLRLGHLTEVVTPDKNAGTERVPAKARKPVSPGISKAGSCSSCLGSVTLGSSEELCRNALGLFPKIWGGEQLLSNFGPITSGRVNSVEILECARLGMAKQIYARCPTQLRKSVVRIQKQRSDCYSTRAIGMSRRYDRGRKRRPL